MKFKIPFCILDLSALKIEIGPIFIKKNDIRVHSYGLIQMVICYSQIVSSVICRRDPSH